MAITDENESPMETCAAAWPAKPRLACSWGDVFDRQTILSLKRERILDWNRLAHVEREIGEVEAVIGDPGRFPAALAGLRAQLAAVNAALWTIEDDIRACERAERFDAAFIALARAVYRENDRRAAIKKRINHLLRSELVEEKSYPGEEASIG